MKISLTLFGLLVGMCLVLGYVLMTEEPPGAAGIPHPEYSSMQRGGDGVARHAPIFVAGWILGLLQIFFLVGLLAFGAAKSKRFPFEERFLLGGAVVYAAFFTWMVTSYSSFAASPSERLVLSFPPPTALMLYGVGFVPLVFVALYVIRFEPWIIDDDELETFLEGVRRAKQAKED